MADCSKLNTLIRLLRTQGKFWHHKNIIQEFQGELLVNKSCFFSTIGGIVCKDGIILGTEKIIVNKMMVSGTDKRIYSVTRNSGSVRESHK